MDRSAGIVAGVIFVFAIFVLAIVLNECAVQSDHTAIHKWASGEGNKVVSVEKSWFYEHPFWFADEDDRIYKVTVKTKTERTKVAYMRFGSWYGPEVRWKE